MEVLALATEVLHKNLALARWGGYPATTGANHVNSLIPQSK
jgi:hypothetical protein